MLPPSWQLFFTRQTMQLEHTEQDNCFFFTYGNLTDKEHPHASILLEQMSWALLSHPDCSVVIWPLLTTIEIKEPLSLKTPDAQAVVTILEQGYLCLSRTADIDLTIQPFHTILCFSHALISTNNTRELDSRSSLLQRVKNKLTAQQKLFLRRKFDALKELLTLTSQRNNSNFMALATSWSAKIIRPQFALNPENIAVQGRIPVLIAVHWLELGGAEKFAIDLIKILPKKKYAIYVTTDIASFNKWSDEITDHVEAIFHLPAFLTTDMMAIFYEYLIRSRNIRLMHIHHAPQAYEALYHIRRFHPQLQILDSLHIIELPPNEGGYVESSARNFESFINHHHVVSNYLQNFLMQRWQIPEDKISVIYLNVDSDHFNPDLVKKGNIRQTLHIHETACVVGFLGRFSRQKQPLEFIKTARLLQQRWTDTKQTTPLVFVMTGSGLLETEIKKAIKDTPRTTILLHPQVQNTLPVYRDCDILMMTSENEGLALVSYESMAMQTPIFFTDVGAQSELLQPEFLIENKIPIAEKFAEAIWPYLIDPEKRHQSGIEMRNYIRKHHHHEQTHSQLLALYQKLLMQ